MTVAELFALAVVLDVPPVWLLADPVSGQNVPIAEGVERDPWDAMLWIIGKAPLSDPSGSWDEAQALIEAGYQVVTVLERFHEMRRLYEIQDTERETEDQEEAKAAVLRQILRSLSHPLQRLAKWGVPLPDVPEDVRKWAAELGVELPGAEG